MKNLELTAEQAMKALGILSEEQEEYLELMKESLR